MISSRRFLVVATAALTLLAGCKPALSPVERGNRDQILEVGNLTEPTDLDPQVITSAQDAKIVLALEEGLVTLDPADLRPLPGAAAGWDVSADLTVYTFHLRPTAKWSDGAPVTAQDFLYAFRRMLSPRLGAEYSYMLYDMANAEAFNLGKLADFSQVGCQALDPLTLRITLRFPTPYFLALLSHQSWFPLRKACIEKYGPMDERGTKWTLPGHYVGNGPFVLAEWRTNEIIKVVKNPHYWDAANVRLHGINFHPIESADTEERAFRAGQLHVTSTLPIEKIDRYRQDAPDVLRVTPFLTTYFYRFNTARHPLDDVRVRRALAMSIDRGELVRGVTRGGQLPAFGLVPPGLPGYPPTPYFQEDVAAARKLLADAGYPDGANFPPLQISFNTNEAHQKIAVAFQAMWHKNLGINVTLQNMESKVLEDTMRSQDYQIARYAWTGDYPDPNSFLTLMTSDGGNNQTGWRNPEYDQLLGLAARTADPVARMEVFHRAEAILMNDMPIMPIYFYTNIHLQRSGVKGWPSNLLDYHPYQRVYLQP